MCDFCKNIGIGIPDWDFLTPDKNGRIPSGDAIEIRMRNTEPQAV